MANLTLMALGSSAPEILLSVIEVVLIENFNNGELGPSTIVGSAAFNLMVITAVCIVCLPPGEVRVIKQQSVFLTTAAYSIFAYIWLLIIVVFWTPEVVTVLEGTRMRPMRSSAACLLFIRCPCAFSSLFSSLFSSAALPGAHGSAADATGEQPGEQPRRRQRLASRPGAVSRPLSTSLVPLSPLSPPLSDSLVSALLSSGLCASGCVRVRVRFP